MARAGASLVGFLVFIGVAVGWRIWFQYRATGDPGLRIVRGGASERIPAALFILGFLLTPLSPLSVLLRSPASAVDPTHPALPAAGLILLVLGFALTVSAQVGMGASWRIGVDRDERTTLVTRGVFARVRNPIYTGILLVLAGMLLLVPSLLAAAALACTWIALQLQVRVVEEPYLMRTHGERYRAYVRQTGRFVPGLGRLN